MELQPIASKLGPVLLITVDAETLLRPESSYDSSHHFFLGYQFPILVGFCPLQLQIKMIIVTVTNIYKNCYKPNTNIYIYLQAYDIISLKTQW